MKLKNLAISAFACIGMAFSLAACGTSGPGEHDHTWDAGTVTTEATCHSEGVRTFKCTVPGCEQTKTENITMTPHNYDAGKVTKEPTCKETGIKTYTCQNAGCGSTKTETIAKVDHNYVPGDLVKVPDLYSRGEREFVCTVCGDKTREEVDPRADFGEQFGVYDNNWSVNYSTGDTPLEIVQKAQHLERVDDSYKHEQFEVTKNTINLSNNVALIAFYPGADSHKLSLDLHISFVGNEDATRVEGYFVTYAFLTGLSDPVPLHKDAKSWSYTSEEALEIADGSIIILYFKNAGTGAPAGTFNITLEAECPHVWNEGVVIKDPTEEAAGIKEYTCVKCGEKYQEEIEPLPPEPSKEGIKFVRDETFFPRFDDSDGTVDLQANAWLTDDGYVAHSEVTKKCADAWRAGMQLDTGVILEKGHTYNVQFNISLKNDLGEGEQFGFILQPKQWADISERIEFLTSPVGATDIDIDITDELIYDEKPATLWFAVEMGDIENEITLSDVVVTDQGETPAPESDYLNFNGKVINRFEEGVVGNTWLTDDDYTLHVEVTTPHASQFYRGGAFVNTGIDLEAGKTYTVSFKSTRKNETPFELILQNKQWEETRIEFFDTPVDEEGVTRDITITEANAGKLWILIQFGTTVNEVTLSDFIIEEKEPVKDYFDFTGKVETRFDDADGTIDLAANSWVANEGREAHAEVTKACSEIWRAGMFVNTGIDMEAGKTYKVSFDVTHATEGAYNVILQCKQWTDAGKVDEQRYAFSDLKEANFVKQFTVTEANEGSLWILVEMGSAVNEITITNLKVEEIAAHEHVWGNEEVITPATCHSAGEKLLHCTFEGCIETKVEAIPATGAHVWDEGVVTTPATCTAKGVKTFHCTNEGCTETKTEDIAMIDHNYVAGDLVVIPDLLTPGEREYVCSVCGAKRENKESVGAHADFEEQYGMAGSKMSYGYAASSNDPFVPSALPLVNGVYKNENAEIGLGTVKVISGVASIGYDFSALTSTAGIKFNVSFVGATEETRLHGALVLTDASGNVKGSPINISADAKDWSYNNSESPLNVDKNDYVYLILGSEGEGTLSYTITLDCEHEWDEGVIDPAATCYQDGLKTYTCSKCGDTKKEVIPATGVHTWDAGTVTTQPTCVAAGEKTFHCTTPGCTAHKEEAVPATGVHTWDAGTVTTAPTCYQKGVKTYTCTVCGAHDTEDIDPTGNHNFDNIGEVTAFPTATQNGVITHHCNTAGCEATHEEEVAKPSNVIGDFFNDFSTNGGNGWLYGYATDYVWEGEHKNDFTFNPLTKVSDVEWGNVAGLIIKNDWVLTEGGNLAFGYNAPAGNNLLTVNTIFTGANDATRIAARLLVVGSDGHTKQEIFIGAGESAKDWVNQSKVATVTGDVVYVILFKHVDDWRQGRIQITVSQELSYLNVTGKVETRFDDADGTIVLAANSWVANNGSEAHAEVTKPCNDIWRAGMFINTGVSMVVGKTYVVSFDVARKNETPFELILQNDQWSNVDHRYKFFDSQVGHIYCEIEVTGDMGGTLWFLVQFGNTVNEITVSNIVVTEKTASTPAYLNLTDRFYGRFDGVTGTAAVKDAGLSGEIDITAAGDADWRGGAFIKTGFAVEAGKSYSIFFNGARTDGQKAYEVLSQRDQWAEKWIATNQISSDGLVRIDITINDANQAGQLWLYVRFGNLVNKVTISNLVIVEHL